MTSLTMPFPSISSVLISGHLPGTLYHLIGAITPLNALLQQWEGRQGVFTKTVGVSTRSSCNGRFWFRQQGQQRFSTELASTYRRHHITDSLQDLFVLIS